MNYKKITLIVFLGVFLSAGRNANAQVNIDSFAYTGSAQTWVVPCATTATVYMWGGGGGAGGGGNNGNFGVFYMNSGGGGGGACVTTTIVTLVPGQVYTITIGAGGAGGNGNGTNGANGDSTTFTGVAGTWTASGGIGGTGQSNTPCCITAAGGAGGSTGTGPNITVYAGGTGSTGYNGDGINLNTGYTGSGGGGGGSGGAGVSPVSGACVLGGTGGLGAHQGGTGGYNVECGNDIDANGTTGNAPGGGGGGDNSWVMADFGGDGGAGQVIIAYTDAIIPVTATGFVVHNASSCGDTGEIAAHTTGVGLSYLWTPSGQTTDTATGLLAGTYTLNVTSPCGGSASATATITQPINVITATATPVSSVLCHGGNNGSASVSISGGGSPYIYTWAPTGQTTQLATGLSAGIYTVTVNDFCLASTTATVTITEPAAINILTNVTANVSCNGGNNGSISTNISNGTPPYGYSWSFGGITDTAYGLAAGTYTLTITDANGCTNSGSVAITQPNVLTTSAGTVIEVACNGSSTGSTISTPNGGTNPYTYAWTGGETNATANGLSAGIYTVNITDNHGCTASASTVITQPTALDVISNTTPDSTSCTGTAWVTASGGVFPYTYAWTPGGNTTYYVHYACHDTFCYVVTDNHGCKDTGCAVITSELGVSNITTNKQSIIVYPNPNSGQFTVESSIGGGQWTVEVYNMLGEKVYTQMNISQTSYKINLGGQTGGIYFYRVLGNENGNLLGEGKLVIEK